MIEIHVHEAPPPNPHDYDHPDNERNLQQAMHLLDRHPGCPTCGERLALVAGPGAEWVLDHRHRPGCPDGKDPEAAEVNVQGGYDPEAHRIAEAIWDRSNPTEAP